MSQRSSSTAPRSRELFPRFIRTILNTLPGKGDTCGVWHAWIDHELHRTVQDCLEESIRSIPAAQRTRVTRSTAQKLLPGALLAHAVDFARESRPILRGNDLAAALLDEACDERLAYRFARRRVERQRLPVPERTKVRPLARKLSCQSLMFRGSGSATSQAVLARELCSSGIQSRTKR